MAGRIRHVGWTLLAADPVLLSAFERRSRQLYIINFP
jgi:hypothetical protein